MTSRKLSPGKLTEEIKERRLQIARLVADEMTDKEIAFRLMVGKKTVDQDLIRLRQMIGCRSRVGVALWYVRTHPA